MRCYVGVPEEFRSVTGRGFFFSSLRWEIALRFFGRFVVVGLAVIAMVLGNERFANVDSCSNGLS